MMFNVNRIQLLLCVTLLIHWTSASPSSRFHAQRSAQNAPGHDSMAEEGTSRSEQSKLKKAIKFGLGLGVAAGGKLALTKAAGVGLGAVKAAGAAIGLGTAGIASAAAAGTGNDVVDTIIEEVDDIVTVEDADDGEEEIELFMDDESEDESVSVSGEDDESVSVSGEDPSVLVTVEDESIPVETVVEADGAPNFFLIPDAQLDSINRLLVSHNKFKQAVINTVNTARTEAEKILLAPVLEALRPHLLEASNLLQSPAEKGTSRIAQSKIKKAVKAGVGLLGPLEITPQVNLNVLNRLLVNINAAANAKLNRQPLNLLNDLGLAAGNIGNVLSKNIIDAANAQLNAGLNIINEATNEKLNRLNDLDNKVHDILAPIKEALQPLHLATGPLQKVIDTPAAKLIQDFENEIVKLLKAQAILSAPFLNIGSQLAAPFVQLGSNLAGLGLKAGKVGLGLGASGVKFVAGLDEVGAALGKLAAVKAAQVAVGGGLGVADLGANGLGAAGPGGAGLGLDGLAGLGANADGTLGQIGRTQLVQLADGSFQLVQSAGLAGPTDISRFAQLAPVSCPPGCRGRNSRDAQLAPPSCPPGCRGTMTGNVRGHELECEIGDGVGGSEQKLRGKFSKHECIHAVKRQFPSANGFTFGSRRGSCRRRCDCYAEFNMRDWEFFGKETWESCFFN